MKVSIQTPSAPEAIGPFSQAIVEGNLVFTAGQIHLTPDGKLVEGTPEERVHQVMENLQAILEGAGVGFKNVVKTTIYITDMTSYGTVSEVYGGYMEAPFPARETVCVKELPLGATVEISMIAIKN